MKTPRYGNAVRKVKTRKLSCPTEDIRRPLSALARAMIHR